MADQMKIDLDAMTVPELEELIEAARDRIDQKRTEARATLRARLEEMAANAGLTLEEVVAPAMPAKVSRQPRQGTGKPIPPKYRTPNGDTWSGRGRMPKWAAAIVAEGGSLDRFKV